MNIPKHFIKQTTRNFNVTQMNSLKQQIDIILNKNIDNNLYHHKDYQKLFDMKKTKKTKIIKK